MSSSRVVSRQRVGASSAGTLMTGQEFDAIIDCDDRYRYELIRGVLVVNPVPLTAEAGPNDELGYLLRHFKYTHPQGSALIDTLPERYVQTTPHTRRRADRVIWVSSGRQLGLDPDKDVPSIVVEFVSKGKRSFVRDYETKRREYQAVGVIEYWIIDRFRRVMTVYRNLPGLPDEQVIQEAAIYRPTLLPGFELSLAHLLAVADRYRRKR